MDHPCDQQRGPLTKVTTFLVEFAFRKQSWWENVVVEEIFMPLVQLACKSSRRKIIPATGSNLLPVLLRRRSVKKGKEWWECCNHSVVSLFGATYLPWMICTWHLIRIPYWTSMRGESPEEWLNAHYDRILWCQYIISVTFYREFLLDNGQASEENLIGGLLIKRTIHFTRVILRHSFLVNRIQRQH